MGITLGEVARQFGVSKGSVSKAISKGKLSATRAADGSSWDIDPAEAVRFFASNPIRSRSPTVENDQPQPGAATDDLVAALRETIALLKLANAGLENDRDEWRDQAKRLSLPAPKPQEPAPATPPEAPATAGEARAVIAARTEEGAARTPGARLRGFLFESDPVWRWWRRSA